jgi:hypothetical protein
MSTPLFFSAFVMNTSSLILHGVWRRPDARQTEFNSLKLWVDLAKELEAGLFDVIEFIKHVMPVLRKRGLAKEAYTPGTLRRKFFGRDTVPATHPAAAYRNAFHGAGTDSSRVGHSRQEN